MKHIQTWWRTPNKDIQSLMEGIHFGHLKTAAWHSFLTELYRSKLNACLLSRIPLERWDKSLTVLLEKEFGSVFFDKLRAIILFEADFNWLQKLIFSKKWPIWQKSTTWSPKNNMQPQVKTVMKDPY